MDTEAFIELLNEDLASEYQSVVQYVQHIAVITGPEYLSTVDELRAHLTQEIQHATRLAEQGDVLGGMPTVRVGEVHAASDPRIALEADLALETAQLDRYRDRVQQAND